MNVSPAVTCPSPLDMRIKVRVPAAFALPVMRGVAFALPVMRGVAFALPVMRGVAFALPAMRGVDGERLPRQTAVLADTLNLVGLSAPELTDNCGDTRSAGERAGDG